MVRELSGCKSAGVGSSQNDPKGSKTLWFLFLCDPFFTDPSTCDALGKEVSWISTRLCAARRVLPALVLQFPILSEVQGLQATTFATCD